jgi:hypothetical protein
MENKHPITFYVTERLYKPVNYYTYLDSNIKGRRVSESSVVAQALRISLPSMFETLLANNIDKINPEEREKIIKIVEELKKYEQ